MVVRRLTPEDAGRLIAHYVASGWLVVGVGSELRCDDGFGPYLARIIKAVSNVFGVPANVVDAGNAPELYTDVMRGHGNVLIIDAVEVPGNYGPGTIVFAEIEERVKEPLIISTHSMNLPVIMRVSALDRIFVLGIIPRCLDYKIGLSRDVAKSLRAIVLSFIECLGEKCISKSGNSLII